MKKRIFMLIMFALFLCACGTSRKTDPTAVPTQVPTEAPAAASDDAAPESAVPAEQAVSDEPQSAVKQAENAIMELDAVG